ncbi:MAG: DUF1203 domain-containing protein [Deltaproteobacteria bacterium]|nr:DUF1203 domain-containing protein [Deltaproteobacteria bacterium]
MSFLIHGLDPQRFARMFTLSDAELATAGAVRRVADSTPGFPCRVSLEDAAVGDELVLLPFEHHAVAGPYRATGPIYVRREAVAGVPRLPLVLDRMPDALARRLVSVRAYDAAGLMVHADVVDGRELAATLERSLGDRSVAYVHVHYAKPGCYAPRVTRADEQA